MIETAIATWPILSLLIFLPLIGAFALYLPAFAGLKLSPKSDLCSRGIALAISLVCFVLSLLLIIGFDSHEAGFQFREAASWIPHLGIGYELGVDGISLFLVILTTFLMPIIVIASASVAKGVRGYLAHMLVLESAMIGALVSLDLFLFYIFWEAMLFPMYFLIGMWGGKRRIYATMKFFLYTVFGSVLMLVAILYLVWRCYEQTGEMTFLFEELLLYSDLARAEELWLFAACALAFGIKVPIFPFHTWLPDAHVEAPTGGSVVLAGVLLKMGLYGFIRFAYPLFPRAAEILGPILAVLAVIGVVYGALVAWAQSDMKKLVAYSSVSHLGYCVLGFVAFNTVSATGSIFQMLSHGISTGALFLLVGVLYDRRHTRAISEYGGLASQMPLFAFLFAIFTLSSIALPLTNGFVGEFLILTGSFQRFPLLTVIALLGVVLGAVYMLGLYKKLMFGELSQEKNGSLKDVTPRELVTFVPLLVLVFAMGIYPRPFLNVLSPSVESYISMVTTRAEVLDGRGGVGEKGLPVGGNPGELMLTKAKVLSAEQGGAAL